METEQEQKKHRRKQSGIKAEKKSKKTKHEQELTAKQRNPKAFAIQSVNKAAKLFHRYSCAFYVYANNHSFEPKQFSLLYVNFFILNIWRDVSVLLHKLYPETLCF